MTAPTEGEDDRGGHGHGDGSGGQRDHRAQGTTGRAGGLRAVLLVARHEVRRVGGAFRRPSTAIGLLVALGVVAAVWPVVLEEGIQPDRGLYAVTVDPASPLAPAVAADMRFHPVAGGLDGEAVLEIPAAGAPRYEDSAPGRAAYRELQEAVHRWQEGRLALEADEAAAFPVEVNVVLAAPQPGAAASFPSPPPTPAPGEAAPPTLSLLDATAPQAATVQEAVRPSEVEPPFPVRSLLLTFAFLIPMNFVAQLYAGTLLADRVRKRALIALTTPHAPRTLLLGRSLPYLVAGAAVLVGAGTFTQAGWLGWLAAVPIIIFVLAASLLLGLLARSERELTFLLTGTTTMLAVFLFLPAVFTAIPAIAFLSPVSVVIASIEGQAVDLGRVVYATVPLALCSLAVALLGMALYREETLFSPRRLRTKLLSALAVRVSTPLRTLAAGALAVPFAFALELLVLSLAIPLGLTLGLPWLVVGILAGVALVEERLKLAVAAARRRRTGSTVAAGAWTGAGFFVGEKLALVLAVVGFGALPLGVPTLRTFGVAGDVLLLAAPLVLHMACTALAASGLGRARPWPTLAYFGAVLVHLGYNLAVVWGVSQ